jgi:hypothetical protein
MLDRSTVAGTTREAAPVLHRDMWLLVTNDDRAAATAIDAGAA